MGKPAARVSDNHVCPKVTSKVPHVGGPIITGSPNVTIGGLPAARVGDTLVCIGPPDKIASGSATVFINGKPAARMGDSTEHGGDHHFWKWDRTYW
ncbi:PAAR domain-containing protein [Photobacterium nomapromontoriensis]|uniref:PAAR domain-containing protein n=1 Tax=Photobacterium nomapromontoriensis TaxID=2910237 RepID=UPI003D12F391